jgi:hypothetical protein
VIAVGLAAGAFATLRSLRGHTRSEIAATPLGCASIGASMPMGLLR